MCEFIENYEGNSLSKILRVLGVIYLIGAVILAVTIFWKFGMVIISIK